MSKLIGQRAIASLLSLVGLMVLVFFLSRLTGDPAALFLPIDATEQMKQQFRSLHGLDAPLIEQFGRYVWDLLQFDFGESLRKARPAIDVVFEAYAWTLPLALITMSLVVVAAIVLGSLAAFNVGGFFDRLVSIISLIGASAPDFWVAIVAIVVFSINLGWLPTSGVGTPLHWVLPIGVLFIRPFGLIVQVVRGSMLSALSAPYVKTARAKGVRNGPIIFTHTLRNAMLPVITVIGDQAELTGRDAGRRDGTFPAPRLRQDQRCPGRELHDAKPRQCAVRQWPGRPDRVVRPVRQPLADQRILQFRQPDVRLHLADQQPGHRWLVRLQLRGAVVPGLPQVRRVAVGVLRRYQ